MVTSEAMVNKHLKTRIKLSNKDLVIPLGFGLFDLFSGIEWNNHSRFRILKFKDKSKPSQCFVVSGTPLSREYRNLLLKEVGHCGT